jgi:UDP-N-acetylglucosamine 4-epimerase
VSSYSKLQSKLSSEPKSWCVTGAAGFIGSHITAKLLELGQTVLGVDNFSTGFEKNIEFLSSKSKTFSFLQKDVQELEGSHLKGVDYVLHQGALGSVPRSIVDPISSHDSNVTGFIKVLKAAKDAKVQQVVYASSSSVYGDEPKLPMVEDRLGKLLSPYAATKKINEVYAEAFSKCYALNIVGLRYFNVFGARQDPDGAYAAVIPKWIQTILKNKNCEIYGDGETSRDFSYVDNVVQANILAATSGISNDVFNIACGEKMTLTELYNSIAEAMLGSDFPKPIYKDFRSGDIRHSFADISKAKSKLGYEPIIFAKEGLKLTVKAYTA